MSLYNKDAWDRCMKHVNKLLFLDIKKKKFLYQNLIGPWPVFFLKALTIFERRGKAKNMISQSIGMQWYNKKVPEINVLLLLLLQNLNKVITTADKPPGLFACKCDKH